MPTMTVTNAGTVIDCVAERAQFVAKYAVEIATQQHHGHDVQWTIGTGKVSIVVMTQSCLTCHEECSWQLKDKTRKTGVMVKPYAGYAPRKSRF